MLGGFIHCLELIYASNNRAGLSFGVGNFLSLSMVEYLRLAAKAGKRIFLLSETLCAILLPCLCILCLLVYPPGDLIPTSLYILHHASSMQSASYA